MFVNCVPGWAPRGPAVNSMSHEYCLATSERLPRVSLLKPVYKVPARVTISKKKENFAPRPQTALNLLAIAWHLLHPSDPLPHKGKGGYEAPTSSISNSIVCQLWGLRRDVCTLCLRCPVYNTGKRPVCFLANMLARKLSWCFRILGLNRKGTCLPLHVKERDGYKGNKRKS